MPRRAMVWKRETEADPIHGSPLVTKFINCLMTQGKKSTAQAIFYGALEQIRDKTKDDPVKTKEIMAQQAPKEDLALLAQAFLDAYTHAWPTS